MVAWPEGAFRGEPPHVPGQLVQVLLPLDRACLEAGAVRVVQFVHGVRAAARQDNRGLR